MHSTSGGPKSISQETTSKPWLCPSTKKATRKIFQTIVPFLSLLARTRFASILQSRLSITIDPHLSTTHYGLRPARSTQQPLYIARRIQDAAEQSGDNTVLCFLDWEKAFNKITHERMFEALTRMNIPAKTVRILQALCTCPTFEVEHDEFKSNVYEQRAGIRQGWPLSPYLFVIVMSVMFADIRPEHHRRLASGKLDHLNYFFMEILYADDTLLISKTHVPWIYSPTQWKQNQLITD